eukprot:11718219-Alexandrium_andersonii.AAC.1
MGIPIIKSERAYGRGYLWAPGRVKPDAAETSARADFCGNCVRRTVPLHCACVHSPSPPLPTGWADKFAHRAGACRNGSRAPWSRSRSSR